MRPIAMILAVLPILFPAAATAQASLNKCIDAEGKVTYSNLPCRNARETRAVAIDPAPLPDPVRAQPAAGKPVAPAERKPDASATPPAPIKLETRSVPSKPVSRASPSQCDALTEKLGKALDKMDQARRKGYTQAEMDGWNQEVKDLERKKQQSGCF
jgi:hypothetical protein